MGPGCLVPASEQQYTDGLLAGVGRMMWGQRRHLGAWLLVGACAIAVACREGNQTTGTPVAVGTGGNQATYGAGGGTAGVPESSSGGAGGEDCPDGTETCPCYGNDTCNPGLTCASGLCVDLGTGGGPGAGGGAIGNGGSPTGGAPGAGGEDLAGGAPGSGGAQAAGAAGQGGVTPGIGGGEFTGAGEAYDPTAFEACASDVRTAESMPADLLIMLDVSVSMGEHLVPEPDGPTRWEVATQGIIEFVQSPQSEGVGVGIHFFPQPAPPDDPSQVESCLVDDYRTPTVEIGLLPENAAAIVGAVVSQQLGNLTPSYPALQGALEHAVEWRAANPTQPVAVVYATDGFPTTCENMDVAAVADLAGQYANPADGSAGIRTFVVGVGLSDSNALTPYLHGIARAGGTHQAQIVYSQNAISDLTERLHQMAFSPITCQLEMPTPLGDEVVDPAEINLLFTPLGGATELIRQVPEAGSCAVSSGGWYYDDPLNPQSILVCEQTCEFFGGGVVELLLGCETQI